ncbi:hypothetical protein ACO1O0_004707 [Amphichorda felina]
MEKTLHNMIAMEKKPPASTFVPRRYIVTHHVMANFGKQSIMVPPYYIQPEYNPNSPNPSTAFAVDPSGLTPEIPCDLTTPSPPVAGCYFPRVLHKYTFNIGVGDPAKPGPMVWEPAQLESRTGAPFSWSMNLPTGDGGWWRVPLSWKRTSHIAVDGMKPSLFRSPSMKLVDSQGTVFAIFTKQSGMSTRLPPTKLIEFFEQQWDISQRH